MGLVIFSKPSSAYGIMIWNITRQNWLAKVNAIWPRILIITSRIFFMVGFLFTIFERNSDVFWYSTYSIQDFHWSCWSRIFSCLQCLISCQRPWYACNVVRPIQRHCLLTSTNRSHHLCTKIEFNVFTI